MCIKTARNILQLFKETMRVVKRLCHRSTCKYNNMQALLSVLCRSTAPCLYYTAFGNFLSVRPFD